MRLIDNLRSAEKKGLAGVRRRVDRAKDEWGDVERRIRQRMRIYPQKLRNRMKRAGETIDVDPETTQPSLTAAAAAAPDNKPIISIHGRDVPEYEIDEKAS
jgi:hypothetical protein